MRWADLAGLAHGLWTLHSWLSRLNEFVAWFWFRHISRVFLPIVSYMSIVQARREARAASVACHAAREGIYKDAARFEGRFSTGFLSDSRETSGVVFARDVTVEHSKLTGSVARDVNVEHSKLTCAVAGKYEAPVAMCLALSVYTGSPP